MNCDFKKTFSFSFNPWLILYALFCLAMYQIIQASALSPLIKTPLRQSNFCKCGTENGPGKIVGGKEVRPYRYPWMAFIGKRLPLHFPTLQCGGALINSKYVLTAAHCLVRDQYTIIDPDSLQVFLGLHELDQTYGKNKMGFDVERVIPHEEYHDISKSNDIGLILLKDDIEPNKYHYICLPQLDEDYTSKKATALGWGRIGELDHVSKKLLQVNLTIISAEDCEKDNYIGHYESPSMICTLEEKKDTCQGDSGGPLMLTKQVHSKQKDYYWEQIGLVSFGYGCARPDIPGVFTRVSYFLGWIYKNTKDAVYCKNPNIRSAPKPSNIGSNATFFA